jgi:predicted enzyme related to lactoylglutathione lyase
MNDTRPVTRFQILARNPERAAEFYHRLFGWTVSTENALAFRELDTGGIPGGIWASPGEGPSMVQLFVEVGDVPAALVEAKAAGATVVVPHQVLPDGDEMAVITDTEGLPFGLFRAGRQPTR